VLVGERIGRLVDLVFQLRAFQQAARGRALVHPFSADGKSLIGNTWRD